LDVFSKKNGKKRKFPIHFFPRLCYDISYEHSESCQYIRKAGVMSQAKVDQYKNYKKNRKKILQREKNKALAAKIAAWAVGIVIIGAIAVGIGSKAVSSYQSYLASRPDYSRTAYVLSDLSGVLETETDAEATE
jgi:hypothetical protein